MVDLNEAKSTTIGPAVNDIGRALNRPPKWFKRLSWGILIVFGLVPIGIYIVEPAWVSSYFGGLFSIFVALLSALVSVIDWVASIL